MSNRQGLTIKGQFRDILIKKSKVIKDMGWKSNKIVEDYGKFLAALMKKQFSIPVGIEYMAVGSSGENKSYENFKSLVENYFKTNEPTPAPAQSWILAKKVEKDNIKFLDADNNEIDEITNKLKIEVTFDENEPAAGTFNFYEFALLGRSNNDTKDLYFINYKKHGQIEKDNTMKLTRTIKLTFPIIKEEEHE